MIRRQPNDRDDRRVRVVASIGGVAGIIAAVAWALMVIVLIYVFVSVTRVLESTKLLIDGIRQETVPLLSEVTGTVTGVNKELDRVDGMVESAGNIVKSAERISAVVEAAVSSPLIKVAAYGAGIARAARKFGKKKRED
jgi:uncharacterized protein YoxC